MTWFTVKPGYKIQVINNNPDSGFFQRYGVLNEDFRFRLAGEIDYIDMYAHVEVSGCEGVWKMALLDWETLVITRKESDKKFLEELYDGEDLCLHERIAARNAEERVRHS